MNQKGVANIVLIVAIVAIIAVGGYFVFVKKSEPVAQQPTPTQTNTTVLPTSKPKLTLDVLKNSEYLSQGTGTRIKLVNGTYPLKPLAGESQVDYFVKLDTDHVVFGDLNNDGQEDAVVILVSRSGGTGTFRQLAVMLNSNGNPSNVANQNLGDRTAINSLTVSSGVISADMTPWDGGTGTRKTVNYKLSGDELTPIVFGAPLLTQEQARTLVLQTWGGCTPDTCGSVTVTLQNNNGQYTVTAIYEGLRDDSSSAQKKVAPVYFNNNVWTLGNATVTQRCRPGRGHQDFSAELCL
jgi:hypothetical protein